MRRLQFQSVLRNSLRTRGRCSTTALAPKGCVAGEKLDFFCDNACFSTVVQTPPSSSPERDLDPTQQVLMSEQVILVDQNDKIIKAASKAEAHLISNNLPLHRAFSLFLFNTKGEMLLQKRADVKATFGGYWTNACCSHPLWPNEKDGVAGVKRATIRKVQMELGITGLHTEDLNFMTRVVYRAEDRGRIWGENEVDYVLLAMKDVGLKPRESEVSEVKYVGREGLRDLFADEKEGKISITPWFAGITKRFIRLWWPALLNGGMADAVKLADPHTMYRFNPQAR